MHRISKNLKWKSKWKSFSAALFASYFLSVSNRNSKKRAFQWISVFSLCCFSFFQKRAKCTSRRSPPCTRRGAPRLMPTSTAVASCTWWWRTGQQSWSLRPQWLWTRWRHDARRRTASWRSGLVQWDRWGVSLCLFSRTGCLAVPAKTQMGWLTFGSKDQMFKVVILFLVIQKTQNRIHLWC